MNATLLDSLHDREKALFPASEKLVRSRAQRQRTDFEIAKESGYAASATEAPLVRIATAFWISSKSNGFDIIMSTPNSS